MERCEKHKGAFRTLHCPVCLIEEREYLQAELKDLKEVQQADYAHAVRNCELVKQLQAENKEKQDFIDGLCSQEPCPKCGYGVTGACYGCEIKRLQAELDELQWVLVTERLPENIDDVVICKNYYGKLYWSQGYYVKNKGWYDEGVICPVKLVIAWKPIILPEALKGE